MEKETNSKVDLVKMKEVKLMIQALKNIRGSADDNSNNKKSASIKEVRKGSSSKVASLPAGPVGTIKIEISEVDLLNKNWLSQIEKSPFPIVKLRPLEQKLLEKYDKRRSESPSTTNTFSKDEVEGGGKKKSKSRGKKKYLPKYKKYFTTAIDPAAVKVAISNEIMENYNNNVDDCSRVIDTSSNEKKEDVGEMELQEEDTSDSQARGTECVNMFVSSVLSEKDGNEPMENTDVGQEIPVTAEIISSELFEPKQKGRKSKAKKKAPAKRSKKSATSRYDCSADVVQLTVENDEPMDNTDVDQEIPVPGEIVSSEVFEPKQKSSKSKRKKKAPPKKNKKSATIPFDSPLDVLQLEVEQDEPMDNTDVDQEIPVPGEIVSSEVFEPKQKSSKSKRKKAPPKKNKKSATIPFDSPLDVLQLEVEQDEPMDNTDVDQEISVFAGIESEICEPKQKSSKSRTKKKAPPKKKKKSATIPYDSPFDVLQLRVEEDEGEFEPVDLKPEDILGKCEMSFVEIPSLPVVLLQPLSHKVIEEAKKGFYIVNDCTDNESVASFEDPYAVVPRKKRKAPDSGVCDEEQVSSEQTSKGDKKPKKKYVPIWPPEVIEVSFTVYKCSLCPYKSKRLDHIKNHLVKHSNAKIYKCSECDYESNKEHMLQNHMLRHPGNKSIEMLVPEYKFISEIHDASDVGPHSIIESFAKVYKCSFCRYSCDDVSLVESHLSSHPDINCAETMVGTEDNKDTADKNDSSNEIVQITPPLPPHLPLPPTNIIFPDDIKLTPIVEVSKPEDKPEEEERISPLEELFMSKLFEICEPKDAVYKSFKCPKCNFKTNIRGNLVRHITLHLNEKLHVCLKCNYETNFLFQFYRHTRNCKGKLKSEENLENASDNSEKTEKNVDDVDMKDLKLFHEINLSKLRRDFTSSPEGDQTKTILINQASDSTKRKTLRCMNCSYESRYKFIFIKHIKLCDGGVGSTVSEPNGGVVNNLAIDDCFSSRLQEPISQEYFNNVISHANSPVVNQDNYNTVNNHHAYEDLNVVREVLHPVRYAEETSCTMCSFQAETREEYVKHLQNHYNYRSYQCINCDFKTNFNYILTQHMSKCQKMDEEVPVQSTDAIEDSPESQRVYECSYCKYKTYFEDQLKAHVVIHSTLNINPSGSLLRCSECNFVTHRKATLNRHMNNHSNASGTPRYVRNSIEQTHPLNCVDNSSRYIVENSRSAYQSPGEPHVDNHFSSYLDTPESIGASDEHETAENLEGHHANYNTHPPHILTNRHENVFVGIHNM